MKLADAPQLERYSGISTLGSRTVIRRLGLGDYAPTYAAMRRFTDDRGAATPDELWVLQPRPVYTVGIAGRAEHFPRASALPVDRADRGGQMTYPEPALRHVYDVVVLAR